MHLGSAVIAAPRFPGLGSERYRKDKKETKRQNEAREKLLAYHNALLGKAHIGEVQSSIWDADTRRKCREAGVTLL